VLVFLLLLAAAGLGQGRLIGVVYDNSGSMVKPTGRYIATGYSFKLLNALLVPGDTLAVMTMQRTEEGAADPELFPCGGAHSLPVWIDRLEYGSNTPFRSVEQMLRFLERSGNPGRSLAILTDGQFTDNPDPANLSLLLRESGLRGGYLILHPSATEQAAIREQRVLPLLMERLNGSPEQGCFSISRPDHSDLPRTMGALFCYITGLTTEQQDTYIALAGRTIRIRSPFPLKRVRLIYQSRSSSIGIAGIEPPAAQRLAVYSMVPPGGEPVYGLAGSIEIPGPSQPDASLQITCSEEVNPAKLFLLLDTNLDLQAGLVSATLGQLTPSGGVWRSGPRDTLLLQACFVSEAGPFRFAPELLPNLSLRARIRGGAELAIPTVDGLAFVSAPFLPGPAVRETVTIDLFAEYPGHFSIQKTLTLQVNQLATRLLLNGRAQVPAVWYEATTCSLEGIEPMQPAVVDERDRALTTKYRFTVTTRPALRQTVETGLGGAPRFVFGPHFFPWRDPHGKVEVRIAAVPVSSLYPEHVVTTRIAIARGPWWCRWLPFILTIAVLLLLATWLIALARTRRFRRNARFYVQRRDPRAHFQPPPEIRHLHSWGTLLLSVLRCASEQRIVRMAGLTLAVIAESFGDVRIAKKSARGVKNLMVDYQTLDTASGGGTRDVRINANTRMTSQDGLIEIRYAPDGRKK
jgi:hypothetical protein